MIVQLGVLIHGRAREILRSLFLFFQLSKNGRFLIIQKWAKQFIEEAIGIDFKMINSLVKLIVISFYDTAFPPYCLTNSQNQLSLRNAHKSSNFRGLTLLIKSSSKDGLFLLKGFFYIPPYPTKIFSLL